MKIAKSRAISWFPLWSQIRGKHKHWAISSLLLVSNLWKEIFRLEIDLLRENKIVLEMFKKFFVNWVRPHIASYRGVLCVALNFISCISILWCVLLSSVVLHWISFHCISLALCSVLLTRHVSFVLCLLCWVCFVISLCLRCVLLCCPSLVLFCVLFCWGVIGGNDNCIPYWIIVSSYILFVPRGT